MDYKIIKSDWRIKHKKYSNEKFEDFEKKVKEHLLEGWKCQGGVSFSSGGEFFQAMVKYNEQ